MSPELSGVSRQLPGLVAKLRLASSIGAVVTTLVGVAVLIGWSLQIETLKRISPGIIAMNPMTAVGFTLGGLSLFLTRDSADRRGSRIFARVVATGLVVLGTAQLAQIIFHWPLSLDQILFHDQLQRESIRNRIAPNTALIFLLIGISSLLRVGGFARAQRMTASTILAVAASLIALLSVIGYSYGVRSFYGIAPLMPMALHSAWAFLIFSLALLAANVSGGHSLVTSSGSGGVLTRRLVPTAIVLPLILGWLRMEGERAGLYNTQVGVALFAISTIATFLFLIWRSARILESADLERNRFEQSLFATNDLVSAVIECSSDIIYAKDLRGCYLLINSPGAQRLGRPLDQIIGATDFDLHSEDRASTISQIDQEIVATGETRNLEVIDTHPEGDRTYSFTKGVLRERSGVVRGLVGIARDITARKADESRIREANEKLQQVLADLTKSHEELKAAQMQLIQAEKMQSVGRLSAGIAHEVKNPLNVLRMGLLCLEEGTDETAEDRATILHEMKNAVTRADTVVSELLAFAAPGSQPMAEADINALVQLSVRFVRHEIISAKVELDLRLGLELPRCMVDARKIEQVLINLLTNACHSMASGGTLTVATSIQTIAPNTIPTGAGDRGGRRLRVGDSAVAITLCDTGAGIRAEDAAQLFDPFFTTKATGKGTGLGLTVCRSIIDLHGGIIRLENREEGGAVATVLLPIGSPGRVLTKL